MVKNIETSTHVNYIPTIPIIFNNSYNDNITIFELTQTAS